jgi:serine/threonine protein kinase
MQMQTRTDPLSERKRTKSDGAQPTLGSPSPNCLAIGSPSPNCLAIEKKRKSGVSDIPLYNTPRISSRPRSSTIVLGQSPSMVKESPVNRLSHDVSIFSRERSISLSFSSHNNSEISSLDFQQPLLQQSVSWENQNRLLRLRSATKSELLRFNSTGKPSPSKSEQSRSSFVDKPSLVRARSLVDFSSSFDDNKPIVERESDDQPTSLKSPVSIRSTIELSSPDPYLSSMTIRGNVSYRNNITENLDENPTSPLIAFPPSLNSLTPSSIFSQPNFPRSSSKFRLSGSQKISPSESASPRYLRGRLPQANSTTEYSVDWGSPKSRSTIKVHGMEINDKGVVNATGFKHQANTPSVLKNTPNFFSGESLASRKVVIGIEIDFSDLYELGTIGVGSTGSITRHFHMPSNQLVAVKKNKIDFDVSKREQMFGELLCLMEFKQTPCDYLVKFIGVGWNGSEVWLVMEYMDRGSLDNVVKTYGKMNENQLKHVAHCILRALHALHQKQLLHRDMKPSNVLANHLGEIKLADFGLLKKVKPGGMCDGAAGTMMYMSPERFTHQTTTQHSSRTNSSDRTDSTGYSFASDIWSFGLTLLYCATGKHTMPSEIWHLQTVHNKTEAELAAYCMQDLILMEEAGGTRFSSECKDFISKCLTRSPLNRADSASLMNHPWLSFNRPATRNLHNLLLADSRIGLFLRSSSRRSVGQDGEAAHSGNLSPPRLDSATLNLETSTQPVADEKLPSPTRGARSDSFDACAQSLPDWAIYDITPEDDAILGDVLTFLISHNCKSLYSEEEDPYANESNRFEPEENDIENVSRRRDSIARLNNSFENMQLGDDGRRNNISIPIAVDPENDPEGNCSIDDITILDTVGPQQPLKRKVLSTRTPRALENSNYTKPVKLAINTSARSPRSSIASYLLTQSVKSSNDEKFEENINGFPSLSLSRDDSVGFLTKVTILIVMIIYYYDYDYYYYSHYYYYIF